jgi:hypothetical protein
VVTGSNSGTATSVGGGFSNIDNLVGTAGTDSFTLAGGTLSGSVNGLGGSDTLTGDNVANTWTITGSNSGTLTGLGAGWSNVENLVGGTNADTFNGIAGASISGALIDTVGTTTLNGILNVGSATLATTTLGSDTTINAAGNVIFTTVDGAFDLAVNTSGTTQFNGAVGSTVALETLTTDLGGTTILGGNVTTTGSQTYNDKVLAGALTLRSTGGGDITATNTTNDFTGTVHVVGHDVRFFDANDLTVSISSSGLANLTTGTGALTVDGVIGAGLTTSSGTSTSFGKTSVGANLEAGAVTDITQTDQLTVTGQSVLHANRDINLAHPGNDFGGAVVASGRNITLVDVNNLVAAVTAGGFADLTAGNTLTASGSTVGDLTTHSGANTIFGPTTVHGNLSATAVTDITQPGVLDVTGIASFRGSSITLGNTSAFSAGKLNFNSLGTVAIKETGDTMLTGINTAGVLDLFSTGALTDDVVTSVIVTNGASFTANSIRLVDDVADMLTVGLGVGGNASFTANAGGINIGEAGPARFGTLTFKASGATGAVSIKEADDTVLKGTNAATSLLLSSTGTITDAPATSLNVTAGNATFTGTSITLADSAGDSLEVSDNASFKATTGGIAVGEAGFVNFGSLTFNSPGAVVIQEDCCMLIAGTNTANSLNLTSTESITNTANAKVMVTTNASFTGTSITLGENAGNVLDVGGTASFTATGTGAAGTIAVGANGAVNFGSLTFNAPGAVSISEDSSTAITGSNTANSLVLSSSGAITDAAGTSLAVTGNANLSGASITLGDNAGDTTNFGTLTFSSPGAVSISEDSNTVLTGANTAGSLTLNSGGTVSQESLSTLKVTGAASIDAGTRAITLVNAGNDFGALLTLIGGTTRVNDANALLVQLTTGETYLIANFGTGAAGGTGQLTVGGNAGNLTAVSNGGVLQWNTLNTTNAILIAGTPLINGVANPAGITGPGATGNVLAANVTYSNVNDAKGNVSVTASNEFVLIARDVPGTPSFAEIHAQTAVLDIVRLNPANRVSILVNGDLRLLADSGVFQFRDGNVGGRVTTLDPDKVKVFIGGVSRTSTKDELAQRAAITSAQQSAVSSTAADARQSFGTDSVTQQIDMGFSGDVGIAPTMGHNVPLEGEIISTPACVSEAKGGQPCKE